MPANPRYDDRQDAIVIADGLASERVAEAVALAGGRVVATLGWAALGSLAAYPATRLLAVEAAAASDDLLAAALPTIEAASRDGGVNIVASLSAAQIDLVSAHLFGRNVQLLVEPTQVERVAALTIAAGVRFDDMVNEASDGEAARLRRLNEEVARIAETLARLTRGEALTPERPAPSVSDRKLGYGGPPGVEGVAVTAHDVRQAIRSRRLRSQFFVDGLFEDPAWDMLLDLFAADLERAQVSVSSLCIAAAVAPTTALRWITKMTDAGLLIRHPDPFDRRRAYMALSDTARGGMRDYCLAVRRAGLSIG